MDKEVRSFNIEFHADPENRMVEGRAIPFNIKSPNREGFREMIAPEAVEGVIESSDIMMLYNHDNSKGFLARSNKGKGTLKIDVREDGVYFSFKAKKDNLSNYIYERLLDGDLDETSFAFNVREDTWTKGNDGVYDRVITRFEKLYDFSIVDNSYYGIKDAVGCKRYAEIQEEERLENEKRMQEAEEAAEQEEERNDEIPEPEAEPEVEPEERSEEPETTVEETFDSEGYYSKIREDLADYLK